MLVQYLKSSGVRWGAVYHSGWEHGSRRPMLTSSSKYASRNVLWSIKNLHPLSFTGCFESLRAIFVDMHFAGPLPLNRILKVDSYFSIIVLKVFAPLFEGPLAFAPWIRSWASFSTTNGRWSTGRHLCNPCLKHSRHPSLLGTTMYLHVTLQYCSLFHTNYCLRPSVLLQQCYRPNCCVPLKVWFDHQSLMAPGLVVLLFVFLSPLSLPSKFRFSGLESYRA